MKKNIVRKIIAIVCIISIVLPMSSQVLAKIENTAEGTTQTFGITLLHQSKTLDKKQDLTFGYSVDTVGRHVYRVFAGSDDYGTTILCLDKNGKFPSEGESDGQYKSLGQATEQTLKTAKQDIDSTKAKKILWLVKNAILPEDSETLKDQKLAKIFNKLMTQTSTTQNPLTIEDIKSSITDDDLVFALQCSIWQITNNLEIGNFHGTTDGQRWDGLTGQNLWGNKGEYIMEIISYYSTQLAGSLDEDNSPKTDPSFNTDTPVTTTIAGRYAFVGPFKINTATNYYSIAMKFQTQEGTDIENMPYLLVDAPNNNARVLPQTKEGLEGKNFYIRVYSQTKARKVKFTLSTSVKTTSAVGTVWDTTNDANQPLLSIAREEEPGRDIEQPFEFDINISTPYDASLRKYISAVKRKTSSTLGDEQWKIVWNTDTVAATETRKPTRTTKSEDANEFNQYRYNHRKYPLEVQVGDRIEYTIIVTNECNTNLIVQSITDYLPPAGLTYVSDDTTNQDNSWVYNEGKKSVTTKKTNQTVLQPEGTTQVKIICEVTPEAVGKVITNIAEITQISDSLSSTVTDIDSTPENMNLPQTEKDWENYEGNSTKEFDNKSDLNDPNYYYKGQEDDDDFEKIVVPGSIDLALRKSIVTVNGNARDRERTPDTAPLRDNEDSTTTSNFTDVKTPVTIKTGDVVVYTIRIYNEGEEDAYAGKIEDYIPKGLGFIPQHKLNISNGWVVEPGANTIKLNTITDATNNLSQSDFVDSVTDYQNADVVAGKATISSTKTQNTKLNAYDKTNDVLSKTEIQVACVVLDTLQPGTIIKNIAAITQYKNSKGTVVEEDVDSDTKNQIVPEQYPADNNIQDDDDFEKLQLTEDSYDLALKKFITGVTSADGKTKEIPEEQQRRLTVTDVTALVNRQGNQKADAVYDLNKTTVEVSKGDYVTYTIRLFNEGKNDAIVKEVIDTVPEGLEFVPYETNDDGTYKSGSNINFKYKWKTFQESTAQNGWQSGIKTTYMENTTIPAFDSNQKTDPASNIEKGLSYTDIQVEFKVVTDKHEPIKNIAEITGDDGDDNDSTPNNKIEEEDDQDYDTVIPQKFDLRLRKFITQIGNEQITDRIPEVSYEDDELKYNHPKDPKIVVKGQTVIYTIRVYNEGSIDGYAAEIKDDMPQGITFLPDHDINKKYGWKMYKADGTETDDVKEATTIRTTYLSKEESDARQEDNLLKAFDSSASIDDKNPDHRDVQVAFEVTQDSVTDNNKVIINTAQISEDQDKDGNPVDDTDSIPDNDKEDEDDIDKEYLEMKYFDLSLLKYVSKVIVTEDGKTKETTTGYDGTENPEPVVKVELNKKKLNKTTVKYVYSIKITNEGEIEGYATEVTDRIPKGLVFFEEDNTEYKWKIKDDNTVTTDYLKDTLLKPGESAIVQIVLRWEKSETNLGQKVNVAEITEDDNEYDIPDIDSTPNNNVDGEDDQDEAIVVLSLTTGSMPMYIVIITSSILLISIGVVLIRKYTRK